MTPPSTGRGIGNVLALSTIVTVIIALPVLLHPQTFIFGVETVGRHYDPFVVMQQFALGGASGIARQPLVDDLGAWLAKGIGPIAAYNLIVLATFPAAAAATYALARFLTGVHRSSLVAALAFAFAPVHVAHAAYHPHIAQVQWIPLYLLALFAAVDRPSLPRLAWLGAAVAALVLSNYYGALIRCARHTGSHGRVLVCDAARAAHMVGSRSALASVNRALPVDVHGASDRTPFVPH